MSGQLHASAALPQEKNPDMDMRLDGPQNRSQWYGEMKIVDTTKSRTLTPRRYTDCATTAHTYHDIKNSVAWVRERTIPTERPPFVTEVSANFCC
jgi:hypothetical protein